MRAATATSRSWRRRVGDQVADLAVQAARADAARDRAHRRDFARCARAGARGRLRRRRDHGQRGLLLNQFLCAAHQPAHRRLGRHAENRMRLAVRDRRAMRAARRRPTSSSCTGMSLLDLVEGGKTWDEIVRAGAGARSGRRDDVQHRHRLARGAGADHRHLGAARGASPGSTRAAASAAVKVPVIASNRINMPEVGRADARRAATPTWCRWRGRSWPIRTGSLKAADGRARRDQHLHRLQPGLPRPHVRATSAPPAWSIRAPGTRPNWSAADRARPSASRWSARARRGCRRRPSAAERGHRVTLFEASAAIGGQFDLAMRIPGKEEFTRDDALLQPPAGAASASTVRLSTRVDAALLARRRLRRRRSWPPASCRGGRRSPGIDRPNVLSYVDVLRGARGRASGSR